VGHGRFSKSGDENFHDFQEFRPKPVHFPLIHSMKMPVIGDFARFRRAQP
jgi:hypothetical protein